MKPFAWLLRVPNLCSRFLITVPGDEAFIRSIVQGMVEHDLLSATAEGETYQLSSHGRQIKETLDQLAEQEKAQAYRERGVPLLQRGIKDIRNFLQRRHHAACQISSIVRAGGCCRALGVMTWGNGEEGVSDSCLSR